MQRLKELLNTTKSIVSFNDDEIKILAGISDHDKLVHGQVLFRENDSGDSVYLVDCGAVEMYAHLGDNLEQTIMAVRSGGFVGALAMIEDEARGINARAAEDTAVYRFEGQKLQAMINQEHVLGVKLLRLINDILSKRLRIAMENLRQNLAWTTAVAGLANLDIRKLIANQVNVVIDLVNGKELNGIIMKAEEKPSGFELFVKTKDGSIHFIPYHAVVTASLPHYTIKTDPDESLSI